MFWNPKPLIEKKNISICHIILFQCGVSHQLSFCCPLCELTCKVLNNDKEFEISKMLYCLVVLWSFECFSNVYNYNISKEMVYSLNLPHYLISMWGSPSTVNFVVTYVNWPDNVSCLLNENFFMFDCTIIHHVTQSKNVISLMGKHGFLLFCTICFNKRYKQTHIIVYQLWTFFKTPHNGTIRLNHLNLIHRKYSMNYSHLCTITKCFQDIMPTFSLKHLLIWFQ